MPTRYSLPVCPIYSCSAWAIATVTAPEPSLDLNICLETNKFCPAKIAAASATLWVPTSSLTTFEGVGTSTSLSCSAAKVLKIRLRR